MCDGAAEWAILCLFGVHVNPVPVLGGIGEHVDLFLRDFMPLARSDALSAMCLDSFNALECNGHSILLFLL